MRLKSVRVQRFKRVIDAAFDVDNINILVGGNNSGKSSIIQALHFGIALLQTIQASGTKWQKDSSSISINPSDVIYSPSEDVYALGRGASLKSDMNQGPRIDYILDSGESCAVTFFKGRNRNIIINVDNPLIASKLAQLDRPFSVSSPGLAGISKREAYVSDGVLFRALARGDANLVLRNILLRLWPKGEDDPAGKQIWEEFLEQLRQIFPLLDIGVGFNQTLDEYIDVWITTNGSDWVPLEIAGTGVLQATQILSYIHRFHPSLIVLDEPDSHLHPDNQRLLCTLLRNVTSSSQIQVILTTHSRHVIDSIGPSSNVLWVREGGVEVTTQDDEIGILMEIGALDIRERIALESTDVVILTEDDDVSPLQAIAESSGLSPKNTVVQPYYGITKLHNLRPLVNMAKKIKPSAIIIIHRDRDFLTAEEAAAWRQEVIAMKAEPFVTIGLDIESYYLNPEYLTAQNPQLSSDQFKSAIGECLSALRDELLASYVNGKTEIARQEKKLGKFDQGKLAVEAGKAIDERASDYAGKRVLKALRARFKNDAGATLKIGYVSPFLKDDSLEIIGKKLAKTTPKVLQGSSPS